MAAYSQQVRSYSFSSKSICVFRITDDISVVVFIFIYSSPEFILLLEKNIFNFLILHLVGVE